MSIITDEIKLSNNECCIVFDFGCYFPYSNPEILTFDFGLGGAIIDDYKINQRYPNKYYQTITKTYGRKVSKLGYPYIMPLDEQSIMLLNIKIGLSDEYINLTFPVMTELTEEKPVCGLSFAYSFDESKFHFASYKKAESGLEYHKYIWINFEPKRGFTEHDVLFGVPEQMERSNTLIFGDVITPHASKMNELLIR